MKLVVERSGGFAGVRRRGEKDGAALSPEELVALKRLLETPSQVAPVDLGADRFTYTIEVHDEAGTRRLTVSEASMPRVLADIALQ